MRGRKTILLTNDDGYDSAGIRRLHERLMQDYTVWIIAPDRERSAISMALSLHHPIRSREVGERVFSVSGTPVDCINLALIQIMKTPPDFIVSGMNLGENLSEDVFFSGTVAGAFSGSLFGIPSMAVSLLQGRKPQQRGFDLEGGAEVAAGILGRLLSLPPDPLVYNVNVPRRSNGQVRVTRLGAKHYQPTVIEKDDPRGRKYYWIGTGAPTYDGPKGTDLWAVGEGYISLSVMRYDLNDTRAMERLSHVFAG